MSPTRPIVRRFSAFSDTPQGGNPAGVVLDASGLSDGDMMRIAAEVGYSETAFLTASGPDSFRVRYFAPEAEVDFCGHATIATGVALGERSGEGDYTLTTNSGPVGVAVRQVDGQYSVTLESPPDTTYPLAPDLLDRLLVTLGWSTDDLDPDYPPLIGYSGNRHPVLVATSLSRLADLDYDFPALQALCREHVWPTIQLVARLGPLLWRARNPFAFGGVVEDPATGSAAVALGAYLRAIGSVVPGDSFVIEQGVEMGRPSRLDVRIGEETIFVTGTAVTL